MNRLLIGSCNDSLLLPCAVTAAEESFRQVNLYESGSLGTAVVMEHEIVLSNRPAEASQPITDLLSDIHTNQFISAQQDIPFASYRTNRMLPTRYRGWVFAISGDPPEELDDPDGPIGTAIPGFLQPVARAGYSGAVLFAWTLSRFYESGMLESIPVQTTRPLTMITSAIQALKKETGLQAIPCTFGLTNRTYSVGFIGEAGMYEFSLPGITDCKRCQDAFSRTRTTPHHHIRMGLLATVQETLTKPWKKLASDQCFLLSQDSSLHRQPVC